ncbi:MAG: hypothetical protein ACUVTU_01175 [Desulfurispora sp.]|uniref:hypothetical protein n=1 Tax=Desulfurispora sp. TaxID=3014275 RepID=UPI0040496A7E
MWLESRQTIFCSRRGMMVEITELIYGQGTRTCQVDRQPFHWQCSEQAGCPLDDCPQYISFLVPPEGAEGSGKEQGF